MLVIEPAGRQLISDVDGVAVELLNEVFEGISDSDLATALRVLEVLTLRLEQEQATRTRGPGASSTPFERGRSCASCARRAHRADLMLASRSYGSPFSTECSQALPLTGARRASLRAVNR